MCEFPISKAACASVATTAIHYFDGRVSITHQNPREAFSLSPVSTGSFSELFSTLATTSLSSFSSLSRWLASRASEVLEPYREGLYYQTECPVNSVPVFRETPFLVVFGAP